MDHSDEIFIVSEPSKAVSSATILEKVSTMKAEVFRKERFVSVLGVEVVDPWGFNWNMLEDPAVSFDDGRWISIMSILETKLLKLAGKSYNTEFKKLFFEFLNLRERVFIVHINRLETTVGNYFSSYFPGSNIEYDDKLGGLQLGTQVNITLKNGEQRKYHVKTHSAGRLSYKMSAAKPINPQELLVYKVLERLGFGCEVHFLQRSPEDVYIATLDAGHNGRFTLFEKAVGGVGDETYGKTLWGSLQIINQNPTLDWNVVEAGIQSDLVAQNFLLQLASLDILSRIFRLQDLLSNPNNFGFLETPTTLALLKIIDFGVTDEPYNFSIGPGNFGGFLVGNGPFDYIRSHRTLRYGLRDRPTAERVKAALHVLTEGNLAESRQCVDSAYEDIRDYITSTETFAAHVSEMMKKLDKFRDALHHNIAFFTESLQSWKAEECK